MNIAFVWWWTGWHIFPVKSLIEFIQSDKNDILNFKNIYWLGESNSLEQKVAWGLDWVNFLTIKSGKLRRYFTPKAVLDNFVDLFKFSIWIFQSVKYLKKYKIDIVFCKGWYVSLPVAVAAKLLNKKVFLHESDTVSWLANKISAKFTTKEFIWFKDALPGAITVWQVLSTELIKFSENEINLKWMDLNKTNVVVMWGSQWAKTIYENLLKLLEKEDFTKEFNFFVILWVKNMNFAEAFSKYFNVKTFDFVSQKQLGYVCNLSDLSITRGGWTSMAEQKLFDIKLIIIPTPFTWWNHQYYNWVNFKENYWDILIEQNDNLYSNLITELKPFKWYKKSSSSENLEEKIIEPAKTILEEMKKEI